MRPDEVRGHKPGTYKDLSQNLLHSRAHFLGMSGIHMLGGIEVVAARWVIPSNVLES